MSGDPVHGGPCRAGASGTGEWGVLDVHSPTIRCGARRVRNCAPRDAADVLVVEALQRAPLRSGSSKLCAGCLDRLAEYLDGLLVGDGAAVQAWEEEGILGADSASLDGGANDELFECVAQAQMCQVAPTHAGV